jgi:hypothetical protein
MADSNTVTGLLNVFGAGLSADLKDTIKTKPLTIYGIVNATENLADSVRYDIKDNVLRVYALDYIYYIKHGRKPGKKPPLKAIEDWIDAKGLIYDISKRSLAFLIQRKIAEEGTTIYQQGGTKLLEDVLNSDVVGKFKSDLVLRINSILIAEMKIALTANSNRVK